MLYILTALGCEAGPLNGLPGTVTITGAGMRAYETLSKIELKPCDKVLNVGVCGSRLSGGSAFYVPSVAFAGSKTLYPDIALWQDLPLMPLTTSGEVVKDMEDNMLYDMEGYQIASWALKVISPSSLCILKIVSDDGSSIPSKAEVTDLIKSNISHIRKAANALNEDLKDIRTIDTEKIAKALHLSFYMRNELEELAHYASVSGKEDILCAAAEELAAGCTNKKQAREALDEIYMRLR